MQHHNALIVLRYRGTGQFIPIRRARIERVFDSQRLVVVRFAVLDFPDPTLKSQWPRIQHIPETHEAESKPGESLCPLIFKTSDSEIENIAGAPVEDGERSGIIDVDRWTYVIDSISHLAFASRSCFLHLHAVYEDDRHRVPRSRIRDGLLSAVSDSAYRLGIISYISTPEKTPTDKNDAQPVFSLTLNTDAAILAPIQASSTVYSRYDDHTLSFRTTEDSGGLGSRATITPSDNNTVFYVPAIELPMYVDIAQWRWWAVLVAAIMYLYSVFGIPSVAPKPSQVWAQAIQAIAVFVTATMMSKNSVRFIWKKIWDSEPTTTLKRALAQMRAQQSQ